MGVAREERRDGTRHRRPTIAALMPSHTADTLMGNHKPWPGTIILFGQHQVRVSILYRCKCQHSGSRRTGSGNLDPGGLESNTAFYS